MSRNGVQRSGPFTGKVDDGREIQFVVKAPVRDGVVGTADIVEVNGLEMSWEAKGLYKLFEHGDELMVTCDDPDAPWAW